MSRLLKYRVGIDRLTLPPLALGCQPENREVEMRCVRRRVSGAADIADNVTSMHSLALPQSVGVAIEVGIVEAEGAGGVELIDGEPPVPAGEQLGHAAILSRHHRRTAGCDDVDGLMRVTGAARLRERITQLRWLHALGW